MNGRPRQAPDDPDHPRDAVDPDQPDEGAHDHAMPLPATSADERHAADPVESDESIAGEEDPGAAVDEGVGDRARRSPSDP